MLTSTVCGNFGRYQNLTLELKLEFLNDVCMPKKRKYHPMIRVYLANFDSANSDVFKLNFKLKFKFLDNMQCRHAIRRKKY